MPSSLARALTLFAVAAAGVAQYFIRLDPNDTRATLAFLAATFVAAVFLARSGDQRSPVPSPPQPSPQSSLPLILVGLGLVGVTAGVWVLIAQWDESFYQGWAAVVVGTAGMSAGLRAFDGPAPWTLRWTETAALLGIVVVGTVLRFHDYADWPGPFTTHAIEEQQTGLGGHRVLYLDARPWEFWLDYHLTALALWFDPEPTFNTIRVPFTVVSALTVIPVYALLRGLVRTPAALFGAALYATLGWNLLYSRCAHPIFPTNLLVVTVLAMLVHYGRTRRLAVVPWIGLLCGYTLYSYAGYRGTPAFALAFLGACLLADAWCWRSGTSDPTARHRAARSLAAVLLVTALTVAVAAPITTNLGHRGSRYYFEAAGRSLANEQYYTTDADEFVAQRIDRIRNSARIFMHVGDGSWTFNAPWKPMLDPVTAVLFVIGFLVACLSPRRGYNGFLIFVFLTIMLVGTVFVQNLDIRRLQGITVFIIAFCAIVLDRFWSPAGPRQRRIIAAIGFLIVGYVGWSSYDLYFRQMAGSPDNRLAFRDQYTTLIHWGYRQPEKRPILLQSFVHRFFERAYHYRYNYSWLIDEHLTGRDLGDATELLDPKTFRHARTVVVQEFFERAPVERLLRKAYPGTTCSEFVEPDSARTALSACEVPSSAAAPRVTATLDARYAFHKGGSEPLLHRREPFLGYGTYPRICYTPRHGQFCHAEWHGTFSVPEPGERLVIINTLGRTVATATVDGKRVPPQGLTVAPGEHEVRVEATLPRDWEAGVRLAWRYDGIEEVIPFYEEVISSETAGLAHQFVVSAKTTTRPR